MVEPAKHEAYVRHREIHKQYQVVPVLGQAHSLRCAACLLALCLAIPKTARPQVPDCTWPTDDRQNTQVSAPWQDNFEMLSRVGVHWMPALGDGDSMSRPLWCCNPFSPPYGSLGLQETWYLRRATSTDTAPIYALKGTQTYLDHMDSLSTSEAWYTLDLGQPLGYGWLSQRPGTSPVTRYLRHSIFDHRTWLNPPKTPAGYELDATWLNYPNSRFAYQRFGNYLTWCDVEQASLQLQSEHVLQNAKLRVRFNPIWGNAIEEITYYPPEQDPVQIVSPGIGDLVQSVIRYGPAERQFNPTQAGGADCADYGETRKWAGSPVLSEGMTFPAPGISKFTTSMKPFNFCNDDYVGNSQWNPLLWKGRFNIAATLGCKLPFGDSGTAVFADVLKIRFEALSDSSAPPFGTPLISMRSGGWLLHSAFGDCRQPNNTIQELFDLATGATLATYNLVCPGPGQAQEQVVTAAPGTGVLFSNTAGDLAVGFARLAGSVPHCPTCSYVLTSRCGASCIDDNTDFIVRSNFYHNLTSDAGNPEFEEVYWVIGTYEEVKTRFGQLVQDGDCEN